jgi:uncharacterized protein YdeI (YjbR/CyaY-like superfamily)
MEVDLKKVKSFRTPQVYEKWLSKYHATETVLWILFYKKGSGRPSITWEEAVIESLAWGWIDGIIKSYDEVSYHQRFTPRKPNSGWSKRNCGHVEKLITSGRMQPSGLIHVEAAKKDGRWDAAYAGQADFEIQEDFLTLVKKNRLANQNFKALDRKSQFAIYYRIQSAKTPETRTRRIEAFVQKLAEGESIL